MEQSTPANPNVWVESLAEASRDGNVDDLFRILDSYEKDRALYLHEDDVIEIINAQSANR